MKAITFQSELPPDGTLNVPPGLAGEIPPGQAVRVVVLLAKGTEEQAWEQVAAADFGMGYADSDAIYDDLRDR